LLTPERRSTPVQNTQQLLSTFLGQPLLDEGVENRGVVAPCQGLTAGRRKDRQRLHLEARGDLLLLTLHWAPRTHAILHHEDASRCEQLLRVAPLAGHELRVDQTFGK